MSLTRRTFALMLAVTPGFGGKSVLRVLTRNDMLGISPEHFLELDPSVWREEYRLSKKASDQLRADIKGRIKQVIEMERRLDGLGVSLVTSADAHYPSLIEELDPDPPGVLFLYGNTKLLEAQTFAVMSSRNARHAELELIEQAANFGVMNSEILVSGHDRPEYQRAALVPLRWGAPRILVLDRGLFQVLGPELRDEAFRAARLWRYQFDPGTDLVVSPFRPESDFVGVNNKVRDRLVACLARRIDFIHIAEGGNMEDLLKKAIAAGRPVRVSDRIFGWRDYIAQGAERLSALES